MDQVSATDNSGRAGPLAQYRLGRRTFLKGAGLAAAGVAAPLLPAARVRAAGAGPGSVPIQHVVVACQENRSFDHYYGFAPFAGQFGVPAGYSQPDGQGGSVLPY